MNETFERPLNDCRRSESVTIQVGTSTPEFSQSGCRWAASPTSPDSSWPEPMPTLKASDAKHGTDESNPVNFSQTGNEIKSLPRYTRPQKKRATRRKSLWLKLHPAGLEPATFGSVVAFLPNAASLKTLYSQRIYDYGLIRNYAQV